MKNLILLFLSLLTLNASAQTRSAPPTSKHFWHQEKTTASSEIIWDIWTDVPNWKDWDSGLKDASINGDFKLDAKGKIISLENRKSKFKIIDFEEGVSYTMKTKLPLSSLYVKRFISEKNGETFITHEVWFKGLTSRIFAKSFGTKFKNILPNVVREVITLAEQKHQQ